MKARRTARRRLPAPEGPRVTCPGCGQAFVPTRAGQKHCRPSCRALAAARPKVARSGDLFSA